MVSVALCTYNGEAYLGKQLDSLFAQTHPISEIVVCDDCSTDNTLEIIQKYSNKYPNVMKVIQNDKHLGTTKNFEKAINLCNKDLIFLCDQDDIWLKDKVVTIVRLFEQNPQKKAIFHNLFLYKNQKSLAFTMWDVLGFTTNVREDIPLLKFLLLFSNLVTGMSLAIRKPIKPIVLNDTGGTHFLHDYLLALTHASKKELLPLNICLGYYRKHTTQQVGYKAYRLDKNYYKRLYDNPLCLYVYLYWRIKYLKKYKSVHPEMMQFIEIVGKEKQNAKNKLSITCILKNLPSFFIWLSVKFKIKLAGIFC